MSMNSDTKPESPYGSARRDNTLVVALQISQHGKRVLVASYDQQRIEKLAKELSEIRGCPEYWMYRAGQTPTASLVDAINGTARIALITSDAAAQFVTAPGFDVEQWRVIMDYVTHCGVICGPRPGQTRSEIVQLSILDYWEFAKQSA